MYVNINMYNFFGVNSFAVDKDKECIAMYCFAEEGAKKAVKSEILEGRFTKVMSESTCVETVNTTNMFLFSERKEEGVLKGSRLCFINKKASLSSPDIKKQYFFIPKDLNEEEQIENLKEQFFNKALKTLPLPIHDDWREYVWKEVFSFYTKAEIYGKMPYSSIYVLNLPDIKSLSRLVEFSHKSHEFKSKFKRVPQISSVLAVSDVENFDFKDFQKFLSFYGKENLEKLSVDKANALMQAFEILKYENKEIVVDNLNFWYTTKIKKVGVMIRRTSDKNEKAKIRNLFLKGLEYFIEDYEYKTPYVNNFKKIYDEKQEALKNKDFVAIKKILDEISYENVAPGAEEMAVVCSKTKLSEESFRKHESEYLKRIKDMLVAPKEYPTLSNDLDNDYSWEMIDMSEPRAWMVGYQTNCCQHLDSCGGECVLYAADNPETSGILRITKKGKVVAQSFFWLSSFNNKGTRTLTMDNIEVLGGEVSDGLYNVYEDVSSHIEKYKNLFKISGITIGMGYLDLQFKDKTSLKAGDEGFSPLPRTLGYSDAGSRQILFSSWKVKGD